MVVKEIRVNSNLGFLIGQMVGTVLAHIAKG
jgi:hypothetical protein